MALGWRDQYNRYKGYFLNIVNLYKQRADLRAFTEVILSITTITIFLVFALKPTALTIIALVKEINEKKETLAALDKKISDLDRASTIYGQNQAAIASLDFAIPSRPQPDTISGQVAGIATKNSVKILGLSVGQVVLVGKEETTKKSSDLKPLPEDATAMPVSINVQGDYQNLLGFLNDLENLRIAAKVDRMGVNSTEADGQKIIVAMVSARIPYVSNAANTKGNSNEEK